MSKTALALCAVACVAGFVLWRRSRGQTVTGEPVHDTTPEESGPWR